MVSYFDLHIKQYNVEAIVFSYYNKNNGQSEYVHVHVDFNLSHMNPKYINYIHNYMMSFSILSVFKNNVMVDGSYFIYGHSTFIYDPNVKLLNKK